MENYRQKLHALIPGGAHTYSRGDDQYPFNAPPILERGEGAYVYDPNGRKILDYGMGLRSVNIGYANKEVADAVYIEAMKGNNLTRPSLTELQAAELLVDTIDSVDMVKFAKHGSTVTTAAIKLARAYTGKKFVCVPHEQPFFSFDDWFIGTTPLTRGVPEQHASLTLKFNYNNIDSLEQLFQQHPNEIAAVMLEPVALQSPCPVCGVSNKPCPSHAENFLVQVQNLCKKHNAVFILDEMISGFRWHLKGAQYFFGVKPDLCTFGKAMANGFAVSALAGKREIMNLGSILNEGAERVFLTSTTHGAEMGGLGAFIKTIEILKRENVIEHFWNYGQKLVDGMNAIAKAKKIEEHFYAEAYPCSPVFVTKDEKKESSFSFRTLFAEKMMENNVMIPAISLSYSHKQAELDHTLDAVEKALEAYKNALSDGIEKHLKSKPVKPVFRKYN